VLKSLLAVMENEPKMSMFAYNTLIWVIGTLQDDKTERCASFLGNIHTYGFDCVNVHKHLLDCILYYLGKPDSKSHSKYIRGTLKTLPYLLKLIQAGVEKRKEAKMFTADDDKNVKDGITQIFQRINEIMQLSDPVMIGTQINAIQAFSAIIPSLGQFFSEPVVSDVVCDFLGKVPHFEGYRQATNEKLLLIQTAVNSDFYLQSGEYQPSLMRVSVH
jgi:hypothetical protein